jgi:hypothetical protein
MQANTSNKKYVLVQHRTRQLVRKGLSGSVRCLLFLLGVVGIFCMSGGTSFASVLPPGDPGSGLKTYDLTNGADAYTYVTSNIFVPSGLPVALDARLNHSQDVWARAEGYAQETLHKSTEMIISREAFEVRQDKKINWNATYASKLLFVKLGGLQALYVEAISGVNGKSGVPESTDAALTSTINIFKTALENNAAVGQDSQGNIVATCNFSDQTAVDTSFAEHYQEFNPPFANQEAYRQAAVKFMTKSLSHGTPIMEGGKNDLGKGDMARFDPTTGEYGVVSPTCQIRSYQKITTQANGNSASGFFYNSVDYLIQR